MKTIKAEKVTWILLGLIALVLIINLYFTTAMQGITKDLASQTEELNRAAQIQVTTISDASCSDCFDISTVVDSITSANVEVTSQTELDYTEASAQELIEKYNIEKLPTVIVTGEIAKEGSPITGLTSVQDALIFENLEPVYLEVSSGEYRGRVQATLIQNSECEDCYDLGSFVDTLKELISISDVNTIELSDASAEVETYNLSEVPAVILSGDLALYPDTVQKLEALGVYVGDDLVLTAKLNPPYWDLADDEAKGLVSIVYLTDDSCEDCYNVNIHKTVLENYGVFLAQESTVDISSSEGQDLVNKYSITQVPTIIASSDMKYYTDLEKVWEKVGSVEDDGSYVFRNVSIVSANYTDLSE